MEKISPKSTKPVPVHKKWSVFQFNKKKNCFQKICNCAQTSLQNHTDQNPGHCVIIKTINFAIKCLECDCEIADTLSKNTHQEWNTIYKFRQLFFKNSFFASTDNRIFTYLLDSLLILFTNDLLKKVFKKIYYGALAIEKSLVMSIFAKSSILIGKFFCLLSKSTIDCELLQDIYESLLKNEHLFTYYEKGNFSEFIDSFLKSISDLLTLPYLDNMVLKENDIFVDDFEEKSNDDIVKEYKSTAFVHNDYDGEYIEEFECKACKFGFKKKRTFRTIDLSQTDSLPSQMFDRMTLGLPISTSEKSKKVFGFMNTLIKTKLNTSIKDYVNEYFFGKDISSGAKLSTQCTNCNVSLKTKPKLKIVKLPSQFMMNFSKIDVREKRKNIVQECIDFDWMFEENDVDQQINQKFVENQVKSNILNFAKSKVGKFGSFLNKNVKNKVDEGFMRISSQNSYFLSSVITQDQMNNSKVYYKKNEKWSKCETGIITFIPNIIESLQQDQGKITLLTYTAALKINDKICDFVDKIKYNQLSINHLSPNNVNIPIALLHRYMYGMTDFKANFDTIFCRHNQLKPHFSDFTGVKSMIQSMLCESIEDKQVDSSINTLKKLVQNTDRKYSALVYTTLSVQISFETFLKILYKEELMEEYLPKLSQLNREVACETCIELAIEKSIAIILEKCLFQNIIHTKTHEPTFLVEKTWMRKFLKYINFDPETNFRSISDITQLEPVNSDIKSKMVQYRNFYANDEEIIEKYFILVDERMFCFFEKAYQVHNFLNISEGVILIHNNQKFDKNVLFTKEECKIYDLIKKPIPEKMKEFSRFQELLNLNKKVTILLELSLLNYSELKSNLEPEVDQEESKLINLKLIDKLHQVKQQNEGHPVLDICKEINRLMTKKTSYLESGLPRINQLRENNKLLESNIKEMSHLHSQAKNSIVHEDCLSFSGINLESSTITDVIRNSQMFQNKEYEMDFSEDSIIYRSQKSAEQDPQRFSNFSISKNLKENDEKWNLKKLLNQSIFDQKNDQQRNSEHKINQIVVSQNLNLILSNFVFEEKRKFSNMNNNIVDKKEDDCIDDSLTNVTTNAVLSGIPIFNNKKNDTKHTNLDNSKTDNSKLVKLSKFCNEENNSMIVDEIDQNVNQLSCFSKVLKFEKLVDDKKQNGKNRRMSLEKITNTNTNNRKSASCQIIKVDFEQIFKSKLNHSTGKVETQVFKPEFMLIIKKEDFTSQKKAINLAETKQSNLPKSILRDSTLEVQNKGTNKDIFKKHSEQGNKIFDSLVLIENNKSLLRKQFNLKEADGLVDSKFDHQDQQNENQEKKKKLFDL